MAILYLLDTNVVSYLIKKNDFVLEKKIRKIPMSQLAISVITEAELYYGLAKKKVCPSLHALVHEFLMRVEICPWDSRVSEVYAALRTQTEESGLSLSAMDLLIAAHASALGATLVTRDKSILRIPNLSSVAW